MMHHRSFVRCGPKGRLQEAIIVSYMPCRSIRSSSWSSMEMRVHHPLVYQVCKWRSRLSIILRPTSVTGDDSYSRLPRPLARVKYKLLVGELMFVMHATWPRIADNDWRCPLCCIVCVKYFLTVEITHHWMDWMVTLRPLIFEELHLIPQNQQLSSCLEDRNWMDTKIDLVTICTLSKQLFIDWEATRLTNLKYMIHICVNFMY